MARTACADIRARGRRPLVVGGTALYLKALLFGMFAGPAADAALRERLRADEAAAPGTLHARLQAVDPAAAARLHPNDLKRLVRALEVHEATGRPISEQQREWAGAPREPYVAVGLRRDPADLRRRIDARVARMAAAGLVDEVRAVVAADALGPTAGEMIGVKELVPALRREIETGTRDAAAIDAALAEIRQHTWVLARRQATWWRRFPGVTWLDVSPEETPEVTGRRVAEALSEPRTS
jgi:tRNA dimethylallyltransferase